MTLSVVRIRFDHGGKTVDGYGFCSMADTHKMKLSNNVLSQESSPPIQTICLTNQDCLIPTKSGTFSCRMKNPAVMEQGGGSRSIGHGRLGWSCKTCRKTALAASFWTFQWGTVGRGGARLSWGVIIIRKKKSPTWKNSKDTDQGYRYLKWKSEEKFSPPICAASKGPLKSWKDQASWQWMPMHDSITKLRSHMDVKWNPRLFWYEEPLILKTGHSTAENYSGSLATWENLSRHGLLNLLRHGGLKIDRDWSSSIPLCLWFDGVSKGDRNPRNHGWSRRTPIPHGGHQLALNAAAGLQLGGSESYPGHFNPLAVLRITFLSTRGVHGFMIPRHRYRIKQELHSKSWNWWIASLNTNLRLVLPSLQTWEDRVVCRRINGCAVIDRVCIGLNWSEILTSKTRFLKIPELCFIVLSDALFLSCSQSFQPGMNAYCFFNASITVLFMIF